MVRGIDTWVLDLGLETGRGTVVRSRAGRWVRAHKPPTHEPFAENGKLTACRPPHAEPIRR